MPEKEEKYFMQEHMQTHVTVSLLIAGIVAECFCWLWKKLS